jgi:hypothetical protein
MRLGKLALQTVLTAVAAGTLSFSPVRTVAAGSDTNLPGFVEAGFEAWAKGGAIDAILMGWQRGGLMEGSNKAANQARYLRSLSPALGTYRSHELIQSKAVSRASQVIYVAIDFQRGVVYGRFLVYRSEKDWVVQNMDFSERPEAIMPWLAFAGDQAQQ